MVVHSCQREWNGLGREMVGKERERERENGMVGVRWVAEREKEWNDGSEVGGRERW